MAVCVAAILTAIAAPAEARQAAARVYAVEGDCAGTARTLVRTVQGMCLGRVWQRTGGEGPRMPRGLLQLADGDWLVTDLGTWDPGRGAVWRMSTGADGGVVWRRLLTGLSMPHTIARGPDGRIYVAEMSRVFAFDPGAADPRATIRVAVGDLPDNRLHENRHPLSSFAFATDGALLVNVGAPSDRCVDGKGAPVRDARGRCAASAEQAMVRRYAPAGPGRWRADWTVFASGLRNSVALAVHPSGAVYQGENSVDLPDPNRPFDEINRLTPGSDHGWPYCTDMATPMPGWRTAETRCGARTAPISLLPPHAAPLAMLYYRGRMFPELDGRMLMAWHGYRRAAGRIVAIETDGEGAPLTDRPARYAVYPSGSAAYPADAPAPRARVLTPGWNAQRGRHPMGAPAGLAVASDGAIWIADDRNAAILRLARD